jgi:hypothetical protein
MAGSATIGAAGGSLSAGDVTVTVPPGALGADTIISVVATSDPPPPGFTALSPIYHFSPDGLVFKAAVTVRIAFTGPPDGVGLAWSSATRDGFDTIDGTVAGGALTAQITHFSRGFVFQGGGSDAAALDAQTTVAGDGNAQDAADGGASDATTTDTNVPSDAGAQDAADGGTSDAATTDTQSATDTSATDTSLPSDGAAQDAADGDACTGLACQQVACADGGTTTITGTVFAPNGTTPLPNVVVYVPNGALPTLAQGASCGCTTATAIASGVSGIDGSFTITNAPVGTNIPVVAQVGKWRRQFSVATVSACAANGAGNLSLPSTSAQGDMPSIAVVTGTSDPLECVLRQLGIGAREFGNSPSAAHVHLYQDTGGFISPASPAASTLYGSSTQLLTYDLVVAGCNNSTAAPAAGQQANVVAFANAGGHLLATHDGYVWIHGTGTGAEPFAGTAQWQPGQANPAQPVVVSVDQTYPRGVQLASWLVGVGASTVLGQVTLQQARHDLIAVTSPSQATLVLPADGGAPSPAAYQFNTPLGVTPAQQRGRVTYADFHSQAGPIATSSTFPSYCGAGPLTPDADVLLLALFDAPMCVQ